MNLEYSSPTLENFSLSIIILSHKLRKFFSSIDFHSLTISYDPPKIVKLTQTKHKIMISFFFFWVVNN